MAIHPDDPPRPLLGLPRIVSSAEDIAFITEAVDVRRERHHALQRLARAPAPTTTSSTSPAASPRRSTSPICATSSNEPDGSFMEADHLDGDTDMIALVEVLLAEQGRRREAGEARWRIPMRPDHGHELLGDLGRTGHHPGYSATGRLKGLAELRGVMRTLSRLRDLPL